jgi:hypothetical protein
VESEYNPKGVKLVQLSTFGGLALPLIHLRWKGVRELLPPTGVRKRGGLGGQEYNKALVFTFTEEQLLYKLLVCKKGTAFLYFFYVQVPPL